MSLIRGGRAQGAASERSLRMLLVLTLILAGGVVPLAFAPTAAAAGNPCGPPVTSVIACENTLPGDPTSDWQVSGAGDSTIQGYATSMSVNLGDTVTFKISTPASSYHLDILRMGYYQGNGARKIVSGVRPTATLPQSQPGKPGCAPRSRCPRPAPGMCGPATR